MTEDESGRAFAAFQRAHFAAADPDHFHWQTGHPVQAAREAALVDRLRPWVRPPLVELGCGEGANLALLGAAARGAVAVDWSPPKVAFARAVLPGVRPVCGSATHPPLRNGAFATVLIRDLLHHLEHPARAMARAAALLRPGGHLLVIEPNGRNPLIAAFAWAETAERGMLSSSPGRLRGLLPRGIEPVAFEMHQPLPIDRALFHHRCGAPGLHRRPWARQLAEGIESAFARCLPLSRRAYMLWILRRKETE